MVLLAVLPGVHGAHREAPATGATVPLPQGLQSEEFLEPPKGRKVPTGQLTQRKEGLDTMYVPGAHTLQPRTPKSKTVQLGQAEHAVAPAWEYSGGLHRSHTLAPLSGEKLLLRHCTHIMPPDAYVPGAQGLHAALACSVEIWPRGQELHFVRPTPPAK